MNMNFAVFTARLEVSEADERRRAERLPIDLEASVREMGESGTDARILNISERGFMAETSGTFAIGTRLWLMLPGRNRASAMVKWVAGDRLGAEFAEPIDLSKVPRQS